MTRLEQMCNPSLNLEAVEMLYTGHFYHRPSGLYLAPYRAYDPRIGRWLSREPLGLEGPNLYYYSLNDPLNLFDPTGLFSRDFCRIGFQTANGAGWTLAGTLIGGPPGLVVGIIGSAITGVFGGDMYDSYLDGVLNTPPDLVRPIYPEMPYDGYPPQGPTPNPYPQPPHSTPTPRPPLPEHPKAVPVRLPPPG